MVNTMQASSSTASLSDSPGLFTKSYRSYFTAQEVTVLSERQRGKLSSTREERGRQIACGFLDAVGGRIGFPRRVIATAQMLYHRFHLFFPLKDFNHMEVCLSTLYVSSKFHDTLKKPLLIILASYAIRFPDLLKGRLHIDPASVDQKMLESDRRRVLSIERLVLETVCFNFRVGERCGFEGIVKVGKGLGLSKGYIKQAWKILIDAHRTLSPLQHPPHSLSLACIYTLSLLLLTPDNTSRLAESAGSDLQEVAVDLEVLREAEVVQENLKQSGEWEETYSSSSKIVDSIAHDLLNLYITTLTFPLSDPSLSRLSSPLSPSETNPPKATSSSSSANPGFSTAYQPSPYWTPQMLTQLKISLREARPAEETAKADVQSTKAVKVDVGSEREDQRGREIADGRNGAEVWGALAEGLGRNDGTVRFMFD